MILSDFSFIANAVYQDVQGKVEEVAKVVAATALLSFAAYVLIASNPAYSIEILDVVVLTPVLEEIVFRTIIQEKIIHNIQRVLNYSYGSTTEEQLENQKVLRIRITGVLFGLAQLRHPNQVKIVKCFFGILSGITYGYLSEKYETVAAPILAHGLNNGILKIPGNPRVIYAAHVSVKIFLSRFSRSSDTLLEFISHKVDSACQILLPE